MRIAMVSEHASPLAALGGEDAGGQNVHVAALSQALAARGHSVEVYTRRDGTELPERVPLGGGVDVVHVPAGPPRPLAKDLLLPYMGEFGDWLALRWRGDPPDVVHAHFWMSGVACLTARRVVRFPFAQTFHALGVVKKRHQGAKDSSPPDRLDIEAALAAGADAVIATATDEVRELLAIGAPAASMHVVPCGVDLELFGKPYGDGAFGEPWWRGSDGRILSLGRLVERKGVGSLIEALARIPDTELVVAGGPAGDDFESDPEVRRLRGLVERYGVADRVRLVGAVPRDQVPGLIRSAHVVACVPWYEPFGIVPLEAMACGRPVVATAVGGMLDTVVDGVTGVHVPPRDPDRLAVVLRELLADAERRAALGRAGAERVRERYTWSRVAADTENVYELLVSQAPAAQTSA
jgi:D-inositol-3-phosphate glycosyltransferase